jgi:hypothetical protein
MGLIVPSDNAVLDYTTISTLIDAVNTLQADVISLKSSLTTVQTQVNADGSTTTTTAPQVIKSGVVVIGSGATSIDVTVPGMSKINSIVGTMYNPSGSVANTSCFAYLHTISGTTATFYISGKTTSNYLKLHWVAVGV